MPGEGVLHGVAEDAPRALRDQVVGPEDELAELQHHAGAGRVVRRLRAQQPAVVGAGVGCDDVEEDAGHELQLRDAHIDQRGAQLFQLTHRLLDRGAVLVAHVGIEEVVALDAQAQAADALAQAGRVVGDGHVDALGVAGVVPGLRK